MEYQMEMMRHLRHVNVDHLHVGWYQSTHFGSFYNKPLLESQFNYQSSIEESVVLIYGKKSLNITATVMFQHRTYLIFFYKYIIN